MYFVVWSGKGGFSGLYPASKVLVFVNGSGTVDGLTMPGVVVSPQRSRQASLGARGSKLVSLEVLSIR